MSAYYALRHTILHGCVPRSRYSAGVEQEIRALLTLHQLLRHTMVQAAESEPGTDPDRCGFTIALLLSAPSPARRARVSNRKVKSSISRYAERKPEAAPTPGRP